jgi:hypothetical protein
MTITVVSSQEFDQFKHHITLSSKLQKDGVSLNYFFSPQLCINIYKPRFLIVQNKYVVLEFSKDKHQSLLYMFKGINNYLKGLLPNTFSCYDFFSEQEESFTIRLSLPKTKYKYTITSENQNGENIQFHLPALNSQPFFITILFKNIWQINNKGGFNIELKHIKY